MFPNMVKDNNSPPAIPITVNKYGIFVKYDTQIETINPLSTTGGIIPANLFFILDVKNAASNVTKLPPSISNNPKPEYGASSKFASKQPTKTPGTAAASTKGKSTNPSAILSCTGPKVRLAIGIGNI